MSGQRPFRRSAYVVVVLLIAFTIWYSIAANYDYGALSGTYEFRGGGETCTLRLNSDRTFQQVVFHSGVTRKSQGQWLRYGEAHVSFSSEFLTLPGEELNQEHEAHGQFEKTIGLFPKLVLAPIPDGPKFHRLLFNLRW